MPSGVIRDSSYDADRHELTVSFANGRVYIYSLVPATVAAALASAPSRGAFFNTHIREHYPFRKVAALVSSATPAKASLIEALKASQEEQ